MTPQDASQYLRQICGLAPVIPVLVVDNVASAEPLAKALISGGLPVLEVTLRTPAALEVIHAMANVAGGIVGAGTVLTRSDAQAAKQAGARFAVSPGATPALLDACEEIDLPLLAGAATASEAMTLIERGYSAAKFFPAGPAGGPSYLKGLGSPLPQIAFCPTGGVTATNASEYLALRNVMCVGGSWVAPATLIAQNDWIGITTLAQEASALRP